MQILIVEDEASIRHALQALLKADHEVTISENGRLALEELKKNHFDVVITDYQMPEQTGLDVIRNGRTLSPSTAFIMMTAYGTIQKAVEAIQLGADDYITKPFNFSEIQHRLKKISEARNWKIEKQINSDVTASYFLPGKSEFTEKANAFITTSAEANSNVLISGPCPVERIRVAKAIHEISPRRGFPFICVDGSIDDENFQLESFNATPSKIELAAGGTLFIDNIDRLGKKSGDRLLQILREGRLVRESTGRNIPLRTKIIGACQSRASLPHELALLLGVLSLDILPLKQRREDISALLDEAIAQMRHVVRREVRISREIFDALKQYDFPGNLLELKNIAEHLALIQSGDSELSPSDLPLELRLIVNGMNKKGLAEQIQEFEKSVILDTYLRCGENILTTATELSVPAHEIETKLRQYGRLNKKAA